MLIVLQKLQFVIIYHNLSKGKSILIELIIKIEISFIATEVICYFLYDKKGILIDIQC